MAQHDYVIANGTGAAVRSDLNGGLAAIVSNNSGATEPGTMYAYQWWPDTTTGLLKIRNAANNAWVTVGTLASANLGLLPLAGGTMTGALAVTAGTAALPGIAVSGDLNTGIYSPGADQLAISTGGTSRLAVSTTAVSSTLAVDVPLGAVGTPSLTFTGDLNTGVFSPGADTIALVTGGTNRVHVTSGGLVGIGTTSPGNLLHVSGTGTVCQLASSNNNNVINLKGNGATNGVWLGTTSSDDFVISSGASVTERFRISNDGSFSSVIPGGSTLYPQFGCRAWVNFNGTGTVAIRASGNVSSITDNAQGDYTVNFTTALADANYCPTVSMSPPYGVGNAAATNMHSILLQEEAPTTSAFRFSCSPEAGGFFDPKYTNVAIFR